MHTRSNTALIMLPYAGGSAYNMRPLANQITELDVFILEWPGRGNRIVEPLLTDITKINEDLLHQALPIIERYAHFVVYGHSMGTILGYTLVKQLFAKTGRYPLHFFVSGSGGPALRERINWHDLPEDEFWANIKSLGGCPEEVFENPDLMHFASPILRADFKTLDGFEYEEVEPLPVPITAIRGLDDEQDAEAFRAWQGETSFPLTYIELTGNHFFIFQQDSAIAEIIQETLKTISV